MSDVSFLTYFKVNYKCSKCSKNLNSKAESVIELLGVYPSKDIITSRDHMKFWFAHQDLHQMTTLVNYTLVK